MHHVDKQSAATGVGSVYGQLVVLGFREYFEKKSEVLPVGLSNEKFVLERRRVANGIAEGRIYSCSTAEAELIAGAGAGAGGGGGMGVDKIGNILTGILTGKSTTTNTTTGLGKGLPPGALVIEYKSDPLK
ncbi:hypothetical protein B484DRAFT_395249, partial [Ochromonadaceae sp. CCMP2298]